MAGYVISPRAQNDIDEIWDYTAEQWSADQADSYVTEIRHAIERMAEAPHRGRHYDHVRPGYRRYRVGVHMIFFRIIDDQIEVVRVLHQNMDFERHL